MKKKEMESPIMKQFNDLKKKHPDALLLFRCGDFYETYHEDAQAVAKILGITLTKRNNGGSGDSTYMAGFPPHALDTYLPKLIRAGKRVAICDPLEEPKTTQKRRGITEIVNPAPEVKPDEEPAKSEVAEEPQQEEKKMEDMTIKELFEYIHKLEEENEKVKELRKELEEVKERAEKESLRANQAEEKLSAIQSVLKID